MKLFKRFKSVILRYELEEKKILQFIANFSPSGLILDVGCGYGRLLELIPDDKYTAYGIDLNPEIVKACKANGLNCFTPEQFESSMESTQFDVILMLHIIEHLSPSSCFKFIDSYLDRLKDGGILIIATPVLTEYFFEDFDHIKPYYPTGINMVFSGEGAQVQYYSRNKLLMIDLWYKKYFLRPTNSRMIYFPKFPIINSIGKLFFPLLFKISCGIIGKTDGWVGVFRKIK